MYFWSRTCKYLPAEPGAFPVVIIAAPLYLLFDISAPLPIYKFVVRPVRILGSRSDGGVPQLLCARRTCAGCLNAGETTAREESARFVGGQGVVNVAVVDICFLSD